MLPGASIVSRASRPPEATSTAAKIRQRLEGRRPSGKTSSTKGIAISTTQISQLKVQIAQIPRGNEPRVTTRASTA